MAPIVRKNSVEVNKSNRGATSVSSDSDPLIQLVEFDIAVTVTEEKKRQTDGGLKGEGKTGALLQVIGIDTSLEGSAQHQRAESVIDNRVSRIKFSVPVLFKGQPYEVHTRTETHLPEIHIGG